VKILAATTNAGKISEFKQALKDFPLELFPLQDLGSYPRIVEDGKNFEENALKKGRALAEYSGNLALADDSGLEVTALGGEPGILSARFGGEQGNDRKNNELLLHRLMGIPSTAREGRFVCVLALCEPPARGGRHWLFRGVCDGRIASAPRGENGFGYDPLFIFLPLNKTFAELDPETKCRVSHRGKALAQLKRELPFLGIIT